MDANMDPSYNDEFLFYKKKNLPVIIFFDFLHLHLKMKIIMVLWFKKKWKYFLMIEWLIPTTVR